MKAHTLYSVARMPEIGVGRNTIYQILVTGNYINKRHVPNQELIDAGYLMYKNKEKYLSCRKIDYVVLYVTDPGILWLSKIITESKTA